MNWWGKLIGGAFGFMLGGPLGAMLGAALGHNFDKGLGGFSDTAGDFRAGHQQRSQAAFFTATFSVMGHICKADGVVTPDEISLAQSIMSQMSLQPEQKKAAIALFDEGKKDDFPLDEILLQFKKEVGGSRNIKRMFVEIQCYAAYADGRLHPAENRLLLEVCDIIGFPRREFELIKAAIAAEFHHQQSRYSGKSEKVSLKDAYAILNISASASDTEVKRAYRRLISQHHPDKLVSKGLPEEMMEIATRKTQEIREAYERIMEDRKA